MVQRDPLAEITRGDEETGIRNIFMREVERVGRRMLRIVELDNKNSHIVNWNKK